MRSVRRVSKPGAYHAHQRSARQPQQLNAIALSACAACALRALLAESPEPPRRGGNCIVLEAVSAGVVVLTSVAPVRREMLSCRPPMLTSTAPLLDHTLTHSHHPFYTQPHPRQQAQTEVETHTDRSQSVSHVHAFFFLVFIPGRHAAGAGTKCGGQLVGGQQDSSRPYFGLGYGRDF